MPIRIAVGNSHLIIAAASICAAITHLAVSESQGTQIPWNLVAITIPAVLIGGQLAGLLAGRIPQKIMHLVLAGFLVFIGLLSAYRASVLSGFHLPSWLLWASVVACLAGMALFARRRSVEAREECDKECVSCAPSDKELSFEERQDQKR
jgi:type III secretory pathway component EscV